MTPEYLDIPIFPLPNVTFFTGTYLPLHVFEPRYKAMVANCMGGDRLLGVTLLKEGWQKDYFGRPPVCKTFGVGKIVDCEELDEGRYNIMLEGLFRVRLVQEFPTERFRTARVQVLADPPVDGAREQVSSLMKDIRVQCEVLGKTLPSSRHLVQAAWAAHPHPLVIANHLASSLVIDAYDRQSILEQDDPLKRLKLLHVQLRHIIYQLHAGHVPNEVVEED